MATGAVVVLIVVLIAAAAFVLAPKSIVSSKHPLLDQVRSNFAMIDPKHASIPLRIGDSAYTENKEVITLCLTDPDTNQYYDINTIMYVALHELAHVVSSNQGHGDEFKKNFADLLKKGAELGIYDPKKPIPAQYCKVGTGR